MPDKFQSWPLRFDMSSDEVIQAYHDGFAGALAATPEAIAEYNNTVAALGGTIYGASAGSAFADSHAGKLVAHFGHVERLYKGCWPGAAQQRGDCVSHSDKNAKLYSHVGDIVNNRPDEKTGVIEGIIEAPPEGVLNGLFSTEAAYWYRGYNGDGWICAEAASVSLKYAGLVIRQNYPELGIDLTKYSGALAGKYGSRKPPEEIAGMLRGHLVYTSTKLASFEEIRDFLGNGYGVASCGSEGFSNQRNEYGISARKGSWSHAMAIIGADDRAETHELFGGPLVLVLNSWGVWNEGPRQVRGEDILIPSGSFWARWKDVQRREYYAYSGVNGWPARSIPDFMGGFK